MRCAGDVLELVRAAEQIAVPHSPREQLQHHAVGEQDVGRALGQRLPEVALRLARVAGERHLRFEVFWSGWNTPSSSTASWMRPPGGNPRNASSCEFASAFIG